MCWCRPQSSSCATSRTMGTLDLTADEGYRVLFVPPELLASTSRAEAGPLQLRLLVRVIGVWVRPIGGRWTNLSKHDLKWLGLPAQRPPKCEPFSCVVRVPSNGSSTQVKFVATDEGRFGDLTVRGGWSLYGSPNGWCGDED